jgi:glyoxylase-like metal-dependent hydrolase (beta-lactamase superfamily II)
MAHCAGLGLVPSLLLLTHGHVDHVAAACKLMDLTGAPLWAHEGDRETIENPHPYFAQLVGGVEPCAIAAGLTDGQEIEVGETRLRVLHTPGHSPGSVCFLAEGVAFTGDTLFAGNVGRTDLPGGDWNTLAESLKRLVKATGAGVIVYPGHGPATTMAREIAENPYLQEL